LRLLGWLLTVIVYDTKATITKDRARNKSNENSAIQKMKFSQLFFAVVAVGNLCSPAAAAFHEATGGYYLKALSNPTRTNAGSTMTAGYLQSLSSKSKRFMAFSSSQRSATSPPGYDASADNSETAETADATPIYGTIAPTTTAYYFMSSTGKAMHQAMELAANNKGRESSSRAIPDTSVKENASDSVTSTEPSIVNAPELGVYSQSLSSVTTMPAPPPGEKDSWSENTFASFTNGATGGYYSQPTPATKKALVAIPVNDSIQTEKLRRGLLTTRLEMEAEIGVQAESEPVSAETNVDAPEELGAYREQVSANFINGAGANQMPAWEQAFKRVEDNVSKLVEPFKQQIGYYGAFGGYSASLGQSVTKPTTEASPDSPELVPEATTASVSEDTVDSFAGGEYATTYSSVSSTSGAPRVNGSAKANVNNSQTVDKKLTKRIWDTVPSVKVEAGYTSTYDCPTGSVKRMQVALKTDGRPLNANVELWQGPNSTPQKVAVYNEDGCVRPFSAVMAIPRGKNSIAVRNTGQFSLSACIAADTDNEYEDVINHLSDKTSPEPVQGGSQRTYSFAPSVASVQILLKTDGSPLNARIEVLQGPNNDEQGIEVYTEDGFERPFFAVIETPGAGNVVRIVNIGPVEFPMTARVKPYLIEAVSIDESSGGWRKNESPYSWSNKPYSGR
jgi:hypothetical protein